MTKPKSGTGLKNNDNTKLTMRRSSGRARVAVPVRAKKPSLCEELSDKCEAQRRIVDSICAWPINHYSLTKLCSCGPEWAAINIKKRAQERRGVTKKREAGSIEWATQKSVKNKKPILWRDISFDILSQILAQILNIASEKQRSRLPP